MTRATILDGTGVGTITNDDSDVSILIGGSGNLIIKDEVPGGRGNNLTIKTNGTDYILDAADGTLGTMFVLPGYTPISGATVNVSGTHATVPISQVNGSEILFNTRAGDDALTIDFSLGAFGKAITYDAGSPTSGTGDSLVLSGGTFAEATFNDTNADTGSIQLTGNSPISYSGLESSSSTVAATQVTLNYSTASETITVSSAGASQTSVVSTAGVATTFSNLTGYLTLNTGNSGDDVVNVSGLGVGFAAALNIDGGTGTDTVNLSGSTNTGGSDLTVTSENINLNSAVAANGLYLTGRAINFNGVVAASWAVVDTSSGIGGITQSGGTLTVTGNTTLAAQATDDIALSQANDFQGAVSIVSGRNVTLVDANNVDLGAGNVAGSLAVTATSNLTDSGTVTIAGTATLSGVNITLNTATNDFSTVVVTSTGSTTLVDADDLNLGASTVAVTLTVTAGGPITQSGGISGSGGLTMQGSSTLTLSQINTYAGPTIVNGGTVLVTGSTSATSNFTVNNGATLAGTGTVNGTVTVASGGTVAPGTLPANTAILNSGSVTFSSGSTFAAELDGLNPGADYDQLNVTGTTVSLSNATLALNILAGLTPPDGHTFVLINNDGTDAVTGTFNGLPEAALIPGGINGKITVITCRGGDGDDVVLIAGAFDYGDAPDGVGPVPNTYPTLLVNDGARHVNIGPHLGANADFEINGQPTANADGDDTHDSDDDDGVSFLSAVVVSPQHNNTANVSVNLQNAVSAKRKLPPDERSGGGVRQPRAIQ